MSWRPAVTPSSRDTDTEVVLRGYEEWGRGVLPRLNGIFAFAIWDPRHGNLIVARDRFGVKPLYYTRRRWSL